MSSADFEPIVAEDARQTPVRLLVVQEDQRPLVDLHDEEMVMTFPHLVVRELIALIGLSLLIVVWALLVDAPLEEVASPLVTPNPAKAPWYFLGLQELLHYYPPLVSGVILPGLVLVALAVVPYFNVNLERAPFWRADRQRKVTLLVLSVAVVSVFFYVSGAHPVWPVIGPTLVIGGIMLLPVLTKSEDGIAGWLSTRSLAFWIFVWFLTVGITLTIIGVFFRGPGWSFTVPWVDGIYY